MMQNSNQAQVQTRILIGLLLTSSARLVWESDRCTNLHNLPRLEFENINCLKFEDTGTITET